jgi:hypothetical protein
MGLSDLNRVMQPVMESHWSRVQSMQSVTEEIVGKSKEVMNKQPQIMNSVLQMRDQAMTSRGGRLDIQV